MQKVTRIVAVVLVLLALLLAIAAITVGRKAGANNATPTTQQDAPTQPVVVAVRDLEPGVAISADALQVVQQAQRPVGGYTRVDQIAGRVPAQKIAAGNAVTSSLIARGLGLQLNPGERAIAVPVDELAGAGNRIEPGDYVDVFLNLQDKVNAGVNNTPQVGQTRLLLSRLRVLSYGADDLDRRVAAQDEAAQQSEQPQQTSGNPLAPQRAATPPRRDAASTGSDDAGNAGKTIAKSAVLAVPVQQADALLLGAQNGKLMLALRHPGDGGIADTELFPDPKKVLGPRSGLSEEQKLALDSPENNAYAGIDSNGLTGKDAAKPQPGTTPHATPRPGSGIEIIRGDGHSSRSSTL